jgi:hypothetical protein
MNMLKQPLKQPGIYSNTSENEIWNSNADDIRLDLSKSVRQKIAFELTRISTAGFAKNNEFASLIALDTGEAVFGLKEGVKKGKDKIEIDLDEWEPFLIKSNECSLLIAHNHPNKAIHSFADIKTFYEYKSVKYLLVISGDKIFNLQRTEDTIEDILVFYEILEKYEYGVEEFTVNGETYYEKLFDFLRKVFGEVGVIYERW